jgi:hypothetical protein
MLMPHRRLELTFMSRIYVLEDVLNGGFGHQRGL